MLKYKEDHYRGKHFLLPDFDTSYPPLIIRPSEDAAGKIQIDTSHDIIRCLNQPYDYGEFKKPRTPLSVEVIPPEQRAIFSMRKGIRVLDMPIKFPGSEVRLPYELAQFRYVIQSVLNYELAINPDSYDEYFCYLSVDQREVKKGTLEREAPCHVDGFQGARWVPKVKTNHTYTVADVLPTVYYPQAFDLDQLDPAVHDYFWEFNRQVAANNSEMTWRPAPWELTLMDAYCVHRGDEAPEDMERTWVRLSFEEHTRIFDRLGNAHNHHFRYRWKMIPRDIEALNLRAFDETCDPTLRCFPWQDPLTLEPNPKGVKTKPNLRPRGKRIGISLFPIVL